MHQFQGVGPVEETDDCGGQRCLVVHERAAQEAGSQALLTPSASMMMMSIYRLRRSWLFSECEYYLPPAFEVFVLGEVRDAFGGEDGGDAGAPEEVGSGGAEEAAELFEGEQLHFCEFVGDVRHLFQEAVRRVVGQDVVLVHIFPAPPVIDQPNYVIEHRFHLLQLAPTFPQTQYRPLHHALRLLVAVEEREQLVHDVRFAVFLGRLQLLLTAPQSSPLSSPQPPRPALARLRSSWDQAGCFCGLRLRRRAGFLRGERGNRGQGGREGKRPDEAGR